MALLDQAPAAEVYARSGIVQIKTSAPDYKEDKLVESLELAAKAVPGVKDAKVFVVPIVPFADWYMSNKDLTKKYSKSLLLDLRSFSFLVSKVLVGRNIAW